MLYAYYIVAVLIAAAIAIGLALYTWQRRAAPGAVGFTVLMLLVAWWSVAEVFEWTAQTRASTIFWARMNYISLVSVPVVWLVFALGFTGRRDWLTQRRLALLAVVPALTLGLVWTNDAHHIMTRQIDVVPLGPLWVIQSVQGPWFWVHAAYGYTLLLVGTVLLFRGLFRLQRLPSRQVALAIGGGVLPPMGANVLFVLGVSPLPHLDWTSLAFTFSGTVLAWSIFRYRLFDVAPIARDVLVDGMADPVIVLDREGRVADLNPAALAVAACSDVEEVMGHPVEEVLPPSCCDVLEETEVTLEVKGQARTYALHISPLHDTHGAAVGRLLVLHDITARKAIEAQIRRRNRDLVLLNKVIAAATSTLDMKGVLTTACRELALAFDLPQAATALANADGTVFTVVAEYLASGRPSALGVEIPVTDNPVMSYILAHKAPLVIDDTQHNPAMDVIRETVRRRGTVALMVLPLMARGELIGTIGLDAIKPRIFTESEIELAANVAAALGQALHNTQLYRELEASTAALRESEQRIRTLGDNLPGGFIYQMVLDKDGATHFSYVSAGFEDILGIPSETYMDDFQAFRDNLVKEDRQKLLEIQAQSARGLTLADVELRQYTADGAVRWIQSRALPRRGPDGDIVWDGFAIDITERKLAEEERERLIAELDSFAHTVAHDLKNPLGVIIGYGEMLQARIGNLAIERRDKMLAGIVNTGHRINRIIRELLLLASVRRLEEVDTGPVEMGAVVQEALSRLEVMIQEAKATVEVPAHWPVASGYAPWLEEVWTNYLSNAIKYGGTDAAPPQVALGAGAPVGGQVRFWVRDSGPGIPLDQQKHLFAPFARLEQTRAEGHGLGLSIVQRIIEKLGGTVGVESDPENGVGSTFYFTLPVADG